MTPEEAAVATAEAIARVPSHFMLHPDTYAHGSKIGLDGFTFYFAGRGGVLGDPVADVAVASFIFFEPGTVRRAWEDARAVMAFPEAVAAFSQCATTWAQTHLPDDLDVDRLAALSAEIARAADVAGAPIFAGWRALPVPTDPKGAALHQLNLVRELRFSFHAQAILSAGIPPLAALTLTAPKTAALNGWPDVHPDATPYQDAMDRSGDVTTARMTTALSVLDELELEEFVALTGAALAAVKTKR